MISPEEKVIKRIRNRKSYIMFKELFDFLTGEPSIEEVLSKFHDVIDRRNGYRSYTNSVYALQSLNQLKIDIKEWGR